MSHRGVGKRSRWLVALAIVVGVAAGCGGDGEAETTAASSLAPTSAPNESDGASTVAPHLGDGQVFTGDGFRIELPAGWTPFGPEDLDFGELLETADEELDLGVLEGQLAALFEQGGLLMAFDFENAKPEFVDNLNILRSIASPLTPSGLNRLSAEQYEGFGATNVVTEVRTVPAGEAALITYSLPQFGNQGFSLTVLGEEYDWTITISVKDLESMTIDPDVVFDSFRIDP